MGPGVARPTKKDRWAVLWAKLERLNLDRLTITFAIATSLPYYSEAICEGSVGSIIEV